MAVLEQNQVVVTDGFADKQELFQYAGRMAEKCGVIDNIPAFVDGLNERENEVSTCLEEGIAVPHCRSGCVRRPAVFVIKMNRPLRWDEEKNEVCLAVLLAVPDNENDSHIRLLSQVARRLVQESFREKVLAVQDAGRLYECFREVEQN